MRGLLPRHWENGQKRPARGYSGHGDEPFSPGHVGLKGDKPVTISGCMGRCCIDGCNRPHEAKGYCSLHYQRWKRSGDPLTARAYPKRGEPLAFFEKAAASETDKCIFWPYASKGRGYGEVWLKGEKRFVHQAMCEAAHGAGFPGGEVAHSCGVKLCINPRHLRWATRRENHADKRMHGTDPRGERGPGAKLTWETVREIRRRVAAGEMQKDVAAAHGISRAATSMIVNRRSWV